MPKRTKNAQTLELAQIVERQQVALAECDNPETPEGPRSRGQDASGTYEALLHRLTVGRSKNALLLLKDTRLFHFDDVGTAPSRIGGFSPRRGLQATLQGQDVFILDTFMRYPLATADVAAIEPAENGLCKLGTVWSCPLRDLKDVRYTMKVEINKSRVLLRNFCADEDSAKEVCPDLCKTMIGAMQANHCSPPQRLALEAVPCKEVRPKAVDEHIKAAAKYGEIHHVHPEDRNAASQWILDLPLPLEFTARSWRCRTCNNRGRLSLRVPLCDLPNLPACALQEYFTVTDDDISRAFPNAVACKVDRKPAVYITARFFFEMAQKLYECFNSREVRRHMCALYSANALAAALQDDWQRCSPYSVAWQLRAVPEDAVLRAVLLRGLRALVSARVQVMRKRQLVYNGKGIRLDGNFQLAKILLQKNDEGEALTVVLGICGLDGSLLIPCVPLTAEAWKDISSVLEPMLQEIRDVMMQCGYSLDESRPVFVSTDSYAKHKRLLTELVAKVWDAQRIVPVQATPKAPAFKRRILPAQAHADATVVTADPQHCIIKLRSLVSPRAADARDFTFDYIDLIQRLSAKPQPLQPPQQDVVLESRVTLTKKAKKLLKAAVELPALKFEETQKTMPARAADRLRNWIQQENPAEASEWMEIFKAKPPRGTLARIARRLETTLHETAQAYRWESIKDFQREIFRLQNWYKPGRKIWARRRGIRRGHASGIFRRQPGTVINAKVAAHLRIMATKQKIQGLFNWRQVAALFHAADVPMQTGTVPVERLWANYIDFFPKAARGLGPEWWGLLNDMGYLRYNCRHFNHSDLPPFARGDVLLAERMDNLVSIARAMQQEADTPSDVMVMFRNALSGVA